MAKEAYPYRLFALHGIGSTRALCSVVLAVLSLPVSPPSPPITFSTMQDLGVINDAALLPRTWATTTRTHIKVQPASVYMRSCLMCARAGTSPTS